MFIFSCGGGKLGEVPSYAGAEVPGGLSRTNLVSHQCLSAWQVSLLQIFFGDVEFPSSLKLDEFLLIQRLRIIET